MLSVNEIFYSIQGEGCYAGFPAIFVRLAGCNLKCEYCDTIYTLERTMSIEAILNRIEPLLARNKYQIPLNIIVFTGGEPTLQISKVVELMDTIKTKYELSGDCFIEFHLETNGTFDDVEYLLEHFNYIAFSPKKESDAERISKILSNSEVLYDADIKVVTDGNGLNSKLIPFATMLMPLSTFDPLRDNIIRKKVWEYCKLLRKMYSPRLQCDLFGKMRGV